MLNYKLFILFFILSYVYIIYWTFGWLFMELGGWNVRFMAVTLVCESHYDQYTMWLTAHRALRRQYIHFSFAALMLFFCVVQRISASYTSTSSKSMQILFLVLYFSDTREIQIQTNLSKFYWPEAWIIRKTWYLSDWILNSRD